jgi:hypothetical protein
MLSFSFTFILLSFFFLFSFTSFKSPLSFYLLSFLFLLVSFALFFSFVPFLFHPANFTQKVLLLFVFVFVFYFRIIMGDDVTDFKKLQEEVYYTFLHPQNLKNCIFEKIQGKLSFPTTCLSDHITVMNIWVTPQSKCCLFRARFFSEKKRLRRSKICPEITFIYVTAHFFYYSFSDLGGGGGKIKSRLQVSMREQLIFNNNLVLQKITFTKLL